MGYGGYLSKSHKKRQLKRKRIRQKRMLRWLQEQQILKLKEFINDCIKTGRGVRPM